MRKFLKSQSGNVSILMGLSIVPLMLATGAAVDMIRANNTRTILQGAADSAAVAGATSKDQSAGKLKKVVEDYLKANKAMDALQYVTNVSQDLDMGQGTFTVKIAGKISTGFMYLAGVPTMDVGAVSQANVGATALELAMVLDNTGSMAGAKIDSLKASANQLITILDGEKGDYSTLKVGVVPFAEYVNVGTGNLAAAWLDASAVTAANWLGCVGSRNAPFDAQSGTSGGLYPALTGQPCNQSIQPLTEDLGMVRAKINAMTAQGNTYVPTGLLWGWNVIDSQQPFTEGMSAAALAAARGRKAIVLMTDGENTISPTYPTHDGFVPSTSNDKLATICANVKGANVEIFTVSFMVTSQPIKDLLSGCATQTANYFDASNSAELYSAFTEIGRSLASIRLTQ
jgi:Flp pilus assembly protein TadG